MLSSGVDPTLALETAENIYTQLSTHSVARTHIKRTLGQSIVQCYMVRQGVDTATYTLVRSLRWAIKQPPGWVFLSFIKRVHKTLQRSLQLDICTV